MTEYTEKVEALRAKWEELDGPPELLHLLQRSISWLERAAAANDTDARCVFLWIAFNAAYAIERRAARDEWDGDEPVDWQLRERYFSKVTRLEFKRVRSAIRARRVEGTVLKLMSNVYVFWGFWGSLTADPFEWDDWRHKERFESERDETRRLLGIADRTDARRILSLVFSRLYVLRNQLMHGCATREGSLNRRQVNDGAGLLEILVPLFVDIMADHPDEDWGEVSFPVREDIREDRDERQRQSPARRQDASGEPLV